MNAPEILVLFLTLNLVRVEPVFVPAKLKLVIDHDGGADDALAITMSLLYETYFDGPKVVALTTVHGNVNQSQVVINSARILELVKRTEVPIYAGATQTLVDGIESDYFFGYDGLGDDGYLHDREVEVHKSHAAVGLIELSKKYEGQLVIMAIGPLTNIALAARLDPDFINRLAQLYIGAGNVYDALNSTETEFNVDMDPEAYYAVADSAKLDKVTFIPFSQIRNSISTSKEWRENVLGQIDTPTMKALNGYERVSLAQVTKWELLDPAVAAIVLNSTVVDDIVNSSNSVTLCGAERGITTNDFSSTSPNGRVVMSANLDVYQQLLIDIYSAEL